MTLNTVGRPASDEELQLGIAFVEAGEASTLWIQYAQILLASNELLMLD